MSYLSWEAWTFVTFDGGHFAHVHKYNYCLGRKFHCFSMPRRWLSCTWDHELVPEKNIQWQRLLLTKELRQFWLGTVHLGRCHSLGGKGSKTVKFADVLKGWSLIQHNPNFFLNLSICDWYTIYLLHVGIWILL